MTSVSDLEYRTGRARLLDVREERRGAERFEFREDKINNQVILEGYAATFEDYDVHGGPQAGGWVEQLGMACFDRTLADMPDVQLLVNHEGLPLARTKSGNLKLSRDRHGLLVRATLDPSDPDVQRLIPKMKRGDMDEMSFAFRVKDQSWDSTYTHRTINELSLQKGDVSVVNYGMNPGTRAVITADAIGTLAQMGNQDLVEARKMSPQKIRRAQAVLARLQPPGAARADDKGSGKGKKPYGNVSYADPKNGKYPIDTKEHARAAWSYINMPKNQKGYSSGELAAIKSRIRGALKKFGVEVSPDKKSAKLDRIDTRVNADGSETLVAVMTDGSRVPLPSRRDAAPGSESHESFGGTPTTDWHPLSAPTDPHDDPFETGEGKPSFGPVPGNIKGAGGAVGGSTQFHPPGPSTNPHDTSVDKELYGQTAPNPHDAPYMVGEGCTPGSIVPHTGQGGSGGNGGQDHHGDPYDFGGSTGSSANDRPNYGDFPQGKVPDNIMGGTLVGDWPSTGVHPGTPPSVGTGPVSGEEHPWDHTSGTISEPLDPAEELDGSTERAAYFYNPYTGDGVVARGGDCDPDDMADKDDEDRDDDEDDETHRKSGLAQALDRTITHAYKLAEGNDDLRKLLSAAHFGLNDLRGIKSTPNNELNRKFEELRAEVGAPDTGTVSENLKWLRSQGAQPVGYGGVINADPAVHVISAAERIAYDKASAARQAATASNDAEEKLRLARREAELNDVIRRKQAHDSRTGRVDPFD
jgi:HK97 family phage prohead protease